MTNTIEELKTEEELKETEGEITAAMMRSNPFRRAALAWKQRNAKKVTKSYKKNRKANKKARKQRKLNIKK